MKNQKGISTFNFIMAIACAFLAFYAFIFIPYQNDKKISQIRNSSLSLTIEDNKILNEFLSKSTPTVRPQGKYFFEGETDGKKYSMTYNFDGSYLTQELVIMDKYKLAGSADYKFSGSVLEFSNVSGDSVLFHSSGQPITVVSKDEIIIEGSNSVYMKSESILEQEAVLAKAKKAERTEMLTNTPINDLSLTDASEKIVTSDAFFKLFIAAIILMMSTMMFTVYRIFHRGY